MRSKINMQKPEFPTIFNKSCTYITFKSAVKHRQLGYGYPRGQTVHLAEATTQDTYSSIINKTHVHITHMYTVCEVCFSRVMHLMGTDTFGIVYIMALTENILIAKLLVIWFSSSCFKTLTQNMVSLWCFMHHFQ